MPPQRISILGEKKKKKKKKILWLVFRVSDEEDAAIA